jgi:drug/metabolite transporter (DMT)-like permease
MSAPFPYAGEAAALASSLFWALAFLVFSRVGAGIPAGALNLGKNTTASVCFVVLLCVWIGSPWPTGMGAEAVLLFVASGVVGLTLCDTLLFRAMQLLGPQRISLLMIGAVPLTAAAALLPPWNEPAPSWAGWAGMGLCLAGVALAVTERHADPVAGAALRHGARLGLVAAVFQAAGVLLARLAFRAHGGSALVDSAEGAAVRLYAGSAGLVVLALLTRRLGAWSTGLRRPGVLPRLVGAAFVGTFLGIWANQAGLSWAAHAGVATTLNQLAPVWLIPLTTIALGTRHNLRTWLSTLVAVLGVLLLGLA